MEHNLQWLGPTFRLSDNEAYKAQYEYKHHECALLFSLKPFYLEI